jgi:aminotransferase
VGKRKLQKSSRQAHRLRGIHPSGIRRFLAMTQQTPSVISLGVGEPDFTPPKHVLDAVSRAMDEGRTHYAPLGGIPELREALAKKFTRDYRLSYNPEGEVLVTVGATEAVFLAMLAFVNPGDEVLIPDPGFVCYRPAVLIAGGIPVSLPMIEDDDGFHPDLSAVTSLVTTKSRVIVTNSPNNPTGAVLTYDEAAELARIAVENDLIVISDEVYEKILYDQSKHFCLATFPDMYDRTVVVNSFSKTYAMTGFRVGYAAGPEDLVSTMSLIQQFTVTCVDGLAQYAATAALEGSQEFVAKMVSEFDRRRRLVHRRLNEVEGIHCSLPKGAFYSFPNIEAFQTPSQDLADAVLRECKVVVTPGSSFGAHGEGFLRLSFATSYGKIDEALDRIERSGERLKSKVGAGQVP